MEGQSKTRKRQLPQSRKKEVTVSSWFSRLWKWMAIKMSLSVIPNSLWSHGPYSPWNFPGQNTGVASLSLLQGIFPTQGSNPGLPHCRQILYQLSHREAQEHWSGWPVPSPGYLPDPGIKPGSPALQADSLPAELSWNDHKSLNKATCDAMDQRNKQTFQRATFGFHVLLITHGYTYNCNFWMWCFYSEQNHTHSQKLFCIPFHIYIYIYIYIDRYRCLLVT